MARAHAPFACPHVAYGGMPLARPQHRPLVRLLRPVQEAVASERGEATDHQFAVTLTFILATLPLTLLLALPGSAPAAEAALIRSAGPS